MTRSTDPTPDPLFDDPSLSHEERIERLIEAALADSQLRLRFEDELARGGMGAVRKAFDSVLQRRMAVKTMHAETYNHVLMVHGFLREAQVTGQLDHPNIVPIHELGRDDDGELFFTMKLVDGESLRALIGRAPPADYDQLKERLEVFVKVCDALAFAHSRGVLHCDIKAANVMVGRYGQVYLMDWGGAQLIKPQPGVDTSDWVRDSLPTPREMKGVLFGTPSYMSPEQASAGRTPIDTRSDIFSMGALLYEIMTGKPPYSSPTAREGVARAYNYDLVAPEDRPHLYPRELIRIAMTAMARDPNDRYQTVEDLQTAVYGLLSGGGNFPTMRVPAGVMVIREGDEGDAAYWIESGTFEVFQERGGVRKSVRVLSRNVFFGETAIFARTRRTASVVALTDGVVKVFTASALEAQLDSMVPWMRSLIQTMAKWFAGPDASQRPAAAAAVAQADEPDEPSVTEMFARPDPEAEQNEASTVPSTTEGASRSMPGWTGVFDSDESVSIDVVADSEYLIDPSDLADGEPSAASGEPTRPLGSNKLRPPTRA